MMKHAVIDIGSNSMRLTLYETEGENFKILFREKNMAGLAGYVDGGILSGEGIERAYLGLLEFRETLDSLGIKQTSVFATASLRNVKNTEEAVKAIKAATGYGVEVLTGIEEARLGYLGAMREVSLTSGAYVDIGGASTEVVSFENGEMTASASFPVGSLNLYRECVKKILPGEGSLKRLQKMIAQEIDRKHAFDFHASPALICVGGTARAVLKLSKKLYQLPDGCQTVKKNQLSALCTRLYQGDQAAAELILQLEPERIHTIVPGAMILQHIFRLFDSSEILVSKYGVREGYLCQKILQSNQSGMDTHKTEN